MAQVACQTRADPPPATRLVTALVLDVHADEDANVDVDAAVDVGAFPVGSHDNRNASPFFCPFSFPLPSLYCIFRLFFLAANLSSIKYLKSRLPLIITAHPFASFRPASLCCLSTTFPKRHCVSLGTHLQHRLSLRCVTFALVIFLTKFAASRVGNPFLLLLSH